MKRREAESIASVAKANESRWFENDSQLPRIDDGGCSVVTVIFDLASQKIERADCNGSL